MEGPSHAFIYIHCANENAAVAELSRAHVHGCCCCSWLDQYRACRWAPGPLLLYSLFRSPTRALADSLALWLCCPSSHQSMIERHLWRHSARLRHGCQPTNCCLREVRTELANCHAARRVASTEWFLPDEPRFKWLARTGHEQYDCGLATRRSTIYCNGPMLVATSPLQLCATCNSLLHCLFVSSGGARDCAARGKGLSRRPSPRPVPSTNCTKSH